MENKKCAKPPTRYALKALKKPFALHRLSPILGLLLRDLGGTCGRTLGLGGSWVDIANTCSYRMYLCSQNVQIQPFSMSIFGRPPILFLVMVIFHLQPRTKTVKDPFGWGCHWGYKPYEEPSLIMTNTETLSPWINPIFLSLSPAIIIFRIYLS